MNEEEIVTLVGNKNKTRYTLIANKSLEQVDAYGATIATNNQVIDGRHVNGYINKGGRDSYRVTGGIDALEVYTSTDVDVLVDGNKIPLSEITRVDLPHRVTVSGSGDYGIEVTGSLRKGWHTSQSDIDYQRGYVESVAEEEDQTYLFSGHLDHAHGDNTTMLVEFDREDK